MADSEKISTEGTVKPALLKPAIIMKIDGPDESNGKESEENEINVQKSESEEFKICSPSFPPSSISNNQFMLYQTKLSKGILKPPQFSLNSNNVTSFTLKPSQLNHFSKNPSNSDKPNSEKTENSDSNVNPVNGETPKFVPLVVPEKTIQKDKDSNQKPVIEAKVSSSSFIFGENLTERAVASESMDTSKASTSLGSNGTSEMLFSNVIKHELKQDAVTNAKEKDTKSLSESAREYEELRANKRKYEEVEVVTGEENETNVLSMSCKLFSFNKVSTNWLELGRGTLRLNDLTNEESEGDQIGSRLVFRTSGSLRVILNTIIWAEMNVEKASEKSIRITALDANGEIKVFLLMSNIEDSNRLYSHLQTRLERLETANQKRKKLENSATSTSN